MDTFTKQPNEAITYTASFVDALKTGDTIASIAYSAIENVLGTVGGDDVPAIDAEIATATEVSALISGGVAGSTYKRTVRVNTDGGEVLEHEFRIKIKEI